MKTDVLIIGGGPAGIVTAVTAKQNYPEKKIVVVRREKRVVVPCGIPYIFGTLRDVEKNIIPDSVLTSKGIDILVDEIEDVDIEKKVAKSKSHGEIEFEKLVLATGSKPIKPPIKGIDGNNVFFVRKNPEYLQELMKRINESESVVIIGGGFIGVEFADDLRKLGKKVSIVELLPHILSTSFDDEFCELAEEELRKIGVELYTNSKVVEIREDGVVLSNGKEIAGDIVIVCVGARPNIDLAEKMG